MRELLPEDNDSRRVGPHSFFVFRREFGEVFFSELPPLFLAVVLEDVLEGPPGRESVRVNREEVPERAADHRVLLPAELQKDRPVIRRRIVFTGAVQGVGFRYRARHAAGLYSRTGWVRNEYDGSVVTEIRGEEEQIDRVILTIKRGTFVRIENMEVKNLPVAEDKRGFR